MGDAFDQNTQVFTDSFKMMEAMQCVLQRVLNEMGMGGGVRYAITSDPTYVVGDRTPDWSAYLREYWLCMLMADFASWLKSLAPEPEEKEGGTLHVPTPGEVETITFGG